jgi:hypothetical protein
MSGGAMPEIRRRLFNVESMSLADTNRSTQMTLNTQTQLSLCGSHPAQK